MLKRVMYIRVNVFRNLSIAYFDTRVDAEAMVISKVYGCGLDIARSFDPEETDCVGKAWTSAGHRDKKSDSHYLREEVLVELASEAGKYKSDSQKAVLEANVIAKDGKYV